MKRYASLGVLFVAYLATVGCQRQPEQIIITREVISTPVVVEETVVRVVTEVVEEEIQATDVVETVEVTRVVVATQPPEPTIAPSPTLGIPDVPADQIVNVDPPSALTNDTVSFYSDAWSSATEIEIEFGYPREWQTSYVSDSGYNSWLISDSDPNEAYWDSLSSGEEILLGISPAIPGGVREFPSDHTVYQIKKSGGAVARYSIENDQLAGYIAGGNHVFILFGRVPEAKLTEGQRGIDIILDTFSWQEIQERRRASYLGGRYEGSVAFNEMLTGYLSLASLSFWTFLGNEGDVFNLEIVMADPEVDFFLSMFGPGNESMLPSSPRYVTGDITIEEITLPFTGVYQIVLFPPVGNLVSLGPFNPPAESHLYGWYDITLDELP